MSITVNFAKGHGTRNDFVLIVDRDGLLALSADQIRWLCDRRAGIGADGVLRAVRAAHIAEWDGDPELWFMDYRNADGSIAQMCGNGLRVFIRHLLEAGLVDHNPVQVATRAGLRTGWANTDGSLRVSMGPATVDPERTWIRHAGRELAATTVDVGNPHAVVLLDNEAQLAGLNLGTAPEFNQAVYPDGTNIEFFVPLSDHDLVMRVHERGVGETQSCGTGVVAVAATQLHRIGQSVGELSVTVPGGRLRVQIRPDGAFLTGPAVVVAHGTVVLPT